MCLISLLKILHFVNYLVGNICQAYFKQLLCDATQMSLPRRACRVQCSLPFGSWALTTIPFTDLVRGMTDSFLDCVLTAASPLRLCDALCVTTILVTQDWLLGASLFMQTNGVGKCAQCYNPQWNI